MKTFEFSPVDNPKFADENADWIKKVNGGKSQREELVIHAEIAAALTNQKFSRLKQLLRTLRHGNDTTDAA